MGFLANRANMTVSGMPGTGTITLGSAVAGCLSFADAGVPDGALVSYVVNDGSPLGSMWEAGLGTYSASAGTLARTTVVGNSAKSTSPIVLTAAAQVDISPLATDIPFLLAPPVDFSATPAAAVDFLLPSTRSIFELRAFGLVSTDAIAFRFSLDGSTFVSAANAYGYNLINMNNAGSITGSNGTSGYGALVNTTANGTWPTDIAGTFFASKSGQVGPSFLGQSFSVDTNYRNVSTIHADLENTSSGRAQKLRILTTAGNNITAGILSLRAVA